MSSPPPLPPLGRQTECDRLDQLIAEVGASRSRALVVRGEAGIGKTVLLDYTAQRAAAHGRVVRANGVETEMELPFAGFHQLVLPILDRVQFLPDPQRQAIETAFGQRSGGPADGLMVALAGLNLLSAVSVTEPTFCIIDDAQWLDQVSLNTLLFISRRLLAEPIGLVFAVRGDLGSFGALPELRVTGLRDRDALQLLASVVRGPFDPRVSRRILAETHGNPLAITQLARGRDPLARGAGFGPSAGMPLSGQIEQSFRRRYEVLPATTRRLLLLASAEPLGDPALLRRAATVLGLSGDAVVDADTGGLMSIGLQVQFEHPLARSAVYAAAAPDEQRQAHRALAEAILPGADPDHRAWHRSQAANGPDEDIAAELESAADRAFAKGGLRASAAILERAALLSTTPAQAVRRTVAAARATYEAGSPDDALTLLAMVDPDLAGPHARAVATRLRGQITVSLGRPQHAIALLLDAAGSLRSLDPATARETYLEALEAAMYAGDFGPQGGLAAVAAEVRQELPDGIDTPGVVDHLLEGMLSWAVDGLPSALGHLRLALDELSSSTVDPVAVARWTWLAYHVALSTWDDDRWSALTERYRASVRAAGALSLLPSALVGSAGFAVRTGDFAAADALLADALTISSAIGLPPTAAVVGAAVTAWRGERVDAERAVDRVARDGSANGVHDSTLANYCTAVLHNGLGNYATALEAARASAYAPQLGLPVLLLPELIEAAARVRDLPEAERALARLAVDTNAAGTPWALGIEAYCRALVTRGERAESLYVDAIRFLENCRMVPSMHRAHLAFGEWLRRERRRTEARGHLQIAFDAFTTMGALGFAERARRELLAAGGAVTSRTERILGELTPQELQVARLAAGDGSNQEIAAQLFISPSTVAYHLSKAFRKLDINSRRQLDGALRSL